VKLHEQGHIAERAYFIWKQNGCPEGNELEHWVQAEAEISARAVNGAPTQPQTRPKMQPAAPSPAVPKETRPRRKKR
jgi:hypothetical protein